MARSRDAARGVRDIAQDIGTAIVLLERAIESQAEEDCMLLSFTVTTPWAGREEYLVVARFMTGGDRMVAFSSGPTVWEALKTFSNRFANKTLTLKEDKYA